MSLLVYVPIMVYLLAVGALILCGLALARGWGIPDENQSESTDNINATNGAAINSSPDKMTASTSAALPLPDERDADR